jgi:hypothetical protein
MAIAFELPTIYLPTSRGRRPEGRVTRPNCGWVEGRFHRLCKARRVGELETLVPDPKALEAPKAVVCMHSSFGALRVTWQNVGG